MGKAYCGPNPNLFEESFAYLFLKWLLRTVFEIIERHFFCSRQLFFFTISKDFHSIESSMKNKDGTVLHNFSLDSYTYKTLTSPTLGEEDTANSINHCVDTSKQKTNKRGISACTNQIQAGIATTATLNKLLRAKHPHDHH